MHKSNNNIRKYSDRNYIGNGLILRKLIIRMFLLLPTIAFIAGHIFFANKVSFLVALMYMILYLSLILLGILIYSIIFSKTY